MSNPLEKIGKAMSEFLQKTLAAIDTIANGAEHEAKTQAAIADLKTRIEADEAEDGELKQVIEALVAKLAAAPAPAETSDTSETATATDGNTGDASVAETGTAAAE